MYKPLALQHLSSGGQAFAGKGLGALGGREGQGCWPGGGGAQNPSPFPFPLCDPKKQSGRPPKTSQELKESSIGSSRQGLPWGWDWLMGKDPLSLCRGLDQTHRNENTSESQCVWNSGRKCSPSCLLAPPSSPFLACLGPESGGA